MRKPTKAKRETRTFKAAEDVDRIITKFQDAGISLGEVANDSIRLAAPELLRRYQDRIRRAEDQVQTILRETVAPFNTTPKTQ